MRIKEQTLEFIIEACRNTQPKEFVGLLRAEEGVITEVLVIPGSRFEDARSSIMEHSVPLDPTIVGSVHSHPGGGTPSKTDLAFFARMGRIHLIISSDSRVSVFDSMGRPASLEIVK
ncbi:MAG: Mov34/MPN/PAD-1 family protein [Candidatus Diapherotrites archaeon]|nr:Mov34/MPN/PAD-1 family protein [Candidatus Diapherotrites archaeon]